MQRLKKYSALLLALKAADTKTRAAIVRSSPDDFIMALIEIVFNFLQGNVKVSQSVLERLKRQRKCLRDLAEQRGRKGIGEAREKLSSKRGGFLFSLLPLIATAIAAPRIAKSVAGSAVEGALDKVEDRAKRIIGKL